MLKRGVLSLYFKDKHEYFFSFMGFSTYAMSCRELNIKKYCMSPYEKYYAVCVLFCCVCVRESVREKD